MFIIKYVTPMFLLGMMGFWFWQDWRDIIVMKNVPPENKPFILATRLGLLAFFGLLSYLVWHSWRKRTQKGMSGDAY
jgi:hypothetical protein